MSIKNLTRLAFLAVALLIIGLLIRDFNAINAQVLGDDASQNVRSGINFAKYGVYSQQPISPAVMPDFRREPLPNFLLAFYLRVADFWSPGLLDQLGQVFSDSFLILVKRINLFWAAALFLGVWWTSVLIFSPLLAAHGFAFLQILVVNGFFVVKAVNNMNTELIAGMVLVWLGAVLLMAAKSRTWRWFVVSGSVFGLMALTKASAAYIAIMLLPLVALILSGLGKRFWLYFASISLGFVITVVPWLVRNQLHFSKPVIAKGGESVLLIRAAFNQMNQRQFADAFYAYAPKQMRRDLLGPLMGLSDNDFLCGGRLSVFNRKLDCDKIALKERRYSDVQSFYQQGKRAIPRELSLKANEKKAFALALLRERPLTALMISFPIGWRGFWGFQSGVWPEIVLNFAAYSALLLAPLMALIERRISWLMVSIVPVSLFMFYAIFSHFLTRYSIPFIPASLSCLSMFIVDLSARLSRRFRPGKAPFVWLT